MFSLKFEWKSENVIFDLRIGVAILSTGIWLSLESHSCDKDSYHINHWWPQAYHLLCNKSKSWHEIQPHNSQSKSFTPETQTLMPSKHPLLKGSLRILGYNTKNGKWWQLAGRRHRGTECHYIMCIYLHKFCI